MTKTPKQAASGLEAGWTALADGRWAAARTSFEEALAEPEAPAAFEGLSWAAWWLDDADAVFGAREDAYRLYKKRGDTAGAARMATWLAVDHLDFHGARAVASGWLRRAHRLLDALEPGPDHGWLAFQDGYLAHASGDTTRAWECAAFAVELGRRFSVPDLEMLGLALEGAALVACAQVEEGMRYLDEATAAALEARLRSRSPVPGRTPREPPSWRANRVPHRRRSRRASGCLPPPRGRELVGTLRRDRGAAGERGGELVAGVEHQFAEDARQVTLDRA